MTKISDGGPAFPEKRIVAMLSGANGQPEPAYETAGGMTLRDWIAGQALLGILSGPASRDGVPVDEWYDAPRHAYGLADAMLDERSKSGGEHA